MPSYSNPRLRASIDDWSDRGAVFVIQTNGYGQRAIRTTINPRTGNVLEKKLTYSREARIVDGDDGRLYIAKLHDTFIDIVPDTMVGSETSYNSDPGYAEVRALFDDDAEAADPPDREGAIIVAISEEESGSLPEPDPLPVISPKTTKRFSVTMESRTRQRPSLGRGKPGSPRQRRGGRVWPCHASLRRLHARAFGKPSRSRRRQLVRLVGAVGDGSEASNSRGVSAMQWRNSFGPFLSSCRLRSPDCAKPAPKHRERPNERD